MDNNLETLWQMEAWDEANYIAINITYRLPTSNVWICVSVNFFLYTSPEYYLRL